MWQFYRRTFIPSQILIVLICLALGLHWHVPIQALLVYALVMELFSVFGAMWSVRLRRRVELQQDMLPRRL